MVGGEVGEEVVVDELAAVVDVDDLGREGEVGEDVVEGLAGGLGATVPGGGAGAPLGDGVGGVHDPEEAFARSPPQRATVSIWSTPGSPVSSSRPGPAGIWAASAALLPECLFAGRGARRCGRMRRVMVETLMRRSSSAMGSGIGAFASQ